MGAGRKHQSHGGQGKERLGRLTTWRKKRGHCGWLGIIFSFTGGHVQKHRSCGKRNGNRRSACAPRSFRGGRKYIDREGTTRRHHRVLPYKKGLDEAQPPGLRRSQEALEKRKTRSEESPGKTLPIHHSRLVRKSEGNTDRNKVRGEPENGWEGSQVP